MARFNASLVQIFLFVVLLFGTGCRCDRELSTSAVAQPHRPIDPGWGREILGKEARKRVSKDRCDPSFMESRCKDGDRSPRCEWVHWATTPPEQLLTTAAISIERLTATLLKRRIPVLDGPSPPRPQGLVFENSPNPPYTLPHPVDWRVDPYHSRSWRRQFQDLSLVQRLSKGTDIQALDQAAYLVQSWASAALSDDDAPSLTWVDHPLASRARHVRAFLSKYLDVHPHPNKNVVLAATRIIMSHGFALAAPACYRKNHNHGVFQDRELLWIARNLDFPSKRALADLAEERILSDQFLFTLTEDGVQRENSTSYAIGYLVWASQSARSIWLDEGKPLPKELEERLGRLYRSLPYLLQPDVKGPVFGDSRSDRLRTDLEKARRSVIEELKDPVTEQALDYLLGQGPPPDLEKDSVSTRGGYASLRSGWPDDARDAIVVHLKASRLSSIHLHDDATSFSLYGHGTRWIVDAGRYGAKSDKSIATYQYSAFAHNLLTIDDQPFKGKRRPAITGHQFSNEQSWVRAEHRNYKHLGVDRLERTLVYSNPGSVAVIDFVHGGSGSMTLTQHFHLGPTLSPPKQVGPGVVRVENSSAMTLYLLHEDSSAKVQLVTGQKTPPQGWFFPDLGKKEAVTDVQFTRNVRFVDGVPTPMRTVLVLCKSSAPAPTVLSTLGEPSLRWNVGGKSYSFRPEPE